MFGIAPRVRRTGSANRAILAQPGIAEYGIRFASLSDIASCPCDVCFAPESDRMLRRHEMTRCAINGHRQR
jgi:hypothetical protein